MIVPALFGRTPDLLYDWAERVVEFLSGRLDSIADALRERTVVNSDAKLHSLTLTSMDADDPARVVLQALAPDGSVIWQLTQAGDLKLHSAEAVTKFLIAGKQVVGPRQAAIADLASTATSSDIIAKVNAILAERRIAGSIAP